MARTYNTLYGLTRTEARLLIAHFHNDIAHVGIMLWNSGKASSIERGILKANKLKKFINS